MHLGRVHAVLLVALLGLIAGRHVRARLEALIDRAVQLLLHLIVAMLGQHL